MIFRDCMLGALRGGIPAWTPHRHTSTHKVQCSDRGADEAHESESHFGVAFLSWNC